MPKFFRVTSHLQSLKGLILTVAPGQALKNMVQKWKTTMPNVQLVINSKHLPSVDRSWLTQQTITQVDFDPLSSDELLEHFNKSGGYPIIGTRLNIPFKEPLLKALASKDHAHPLKIIGQAGSAISHIDLLAAEKYNIKVICTPGANAKAVAEYVVAQIFNLTRSLDTFHRHSQQGTWFKYSLPPQSEIHEKTLGLIGYGYIGKELGKKAQDLGMEVMIFTRTTPDCSDLGRIKVVENLETLLKQADIISIHAPLTPATKGLIGAREIGLMKEGSYLINTARGGIVDEAAVAEELRKPNSRLAGAAFDVFAIEGEKFTSPLIGTKAILTPHIAGTTTLALSCAATQMVENIHAELSRSKTVDDSDTPEPSTTLTSRL